MANKLEQLKQFSVVVADTGDLDAVRKFRPQDCTTNPSIVLKALQGPAFERHFDAAVSELGSWNDAVSRIADRLTVDVGTELVSLVPGRVSTEVDARLSYDANASEAKARAIIAEYESRGVGRDRILIKLAATWEGIQAAKRLQRDGIDCNLTLLFSLGQAVACADAGVFLISPFVGRITDWYSKASGLTYAPQDDPGVASVRRIFQYYKAHEIKTVVMGASFRNIGQIEALAGCDRLTIAPALLDQLASDTGPLTKTLSATDRAEDALDAGESEFRWMLSEDPMATEKLAEGIRNFHVDAMKLQKMIHERIASR